MPKPNKADLIEQMLSEQRLRTEAADAHLTTLQADQDAKKKATVCVCEHPDPVMQADGRFYCYQCSLPRPSQICERCRVTIVDTQADQDAGKTLTDKQE